MTFKRRPGFSEFSQKLLNTLAPSKTAHSLIVRCTMTEKLFFYFSLFIYIHTSSFHPISLRLQAKAICIFDSSLKRRQKRSDNRPERRTGQLGDKKRGPFGTVESKFWSYSSTRRGQTGPKRTGPKLPSPQRHHRRPVKEPEALLNPPRLTCPWMGHRAAASRRCWWGDKPAIGRLLTARAAVSFPTQRCLRAINTFSFERRI